MTTYKTPALLAALMGACWAVTPAAAQDADADAPLIENGSPLVERGTLTDDDERMPDDSAFDAYTFRATAGERITVELESDDYDTFLFVRGEALETQLTSDDADGTTTNSRLVFTAPADGVYTALSTSFDSSARGAYTVSISSSGMAPAEPEPAPEPEPAEQEERDPMHFEGTLVDEDPRLNDDSPFDSYLFAANRGDTVVIELASDDYDAYLILVGEPLDEMLENNDADGTTTNSRIEFTAPADGVYQAGATCWDPASRGGYTLTIHGALPYNPWPEYEAQPIQGVTPGGGPVVTEGALTDDDQVLFDDSPFDPYAIHARAGDTIVAEMSSDELDTYLVLSSDQMQTAIENDDRAPNDTNSRVEFLVQEDGEYHLLANGFDPTARGAYTLTVEVVAGEGADEADEAVEDAVEDAAEDAAEEDADKSAPAPGKKPAARKQDADGDDDAPDASGAVALPRMSVGDAPVTMEGNLEEDDPRQQDGSPYDAYILRASAGDTIVLEMSSDAVDTFVIITSDTMDEPVANDDAEQGNTNSRLVHRVQEDGDYIIVATCYDPDDRGAYTLSAQLTRNDLRPEPRRDDDAQGRQGGGEDAPGVPVELGNGDQRTEDGSITDDDPVREDGRPYDAYTFVAQEGEQIALDLRSEDLDPYLAVISEHLDEPIVNDDYNNSRRHSRVTFTAPATGEYTVHATCFDDDDRGDYTLTFGSFYSAEGELTRDDPTLANGEHVDWYDITCEEGQLMLLQVDGVGFDTYLIFADPDGSWEENDDAGSTTTSRIESNVFQPGQYRVGVTSYEGGETGPYTLTISTAEGYRATRVNGGVVHAEFDGSEAILTEHGYVDAYAFEAQEGNTIIVTMASDDVDTVLKIKGPGRLNEMNDDFAPGSTDSQMAFRVAEAGTYYLSATTFGAGETGDYKLDIQLDANKHDAGDWAVKEGGTVYGVFVGINDYPGDGGDLPYCDADATRVARTFRRHFGMDRDHSIVLTNDEATADAIRDAINEMGAKAGPDDMFVFFYSGHGDQVPREGAPQVADPDGNDETLSVYDGDIIDDEFAQMLDDINAGTTLVVIDACFSGGLAKDVVTRPGRIGIFSSEGDCLSMVAGKYQAGGYLSLFFTEAFNDDKDKADLNGDHMLTAHELTFYLQERFNEVVRSGPRGQPSRLYPSGAIDPGGNLGYQRIISDRDGVSPHIILMDW